MTNSSLLWILFALLAPLGSSGSTRAYYSGLHRNVNNRYERNNETANNRYERTHGNFDGHYRTNHANTGTQHNINNGNTGRTHNNNHGSARGRTYIGYLYGHNHGNIGIQYTGNPGNIGSRPDGSHGNTGNVHEGYYEKMDTRPLDPEVYEAFNNLTRGVLRNNSLRGSVEFILESVRRTINEEPLERYYNNLFPGRIPGPESLRDRIAVVGAGPSGIHMAYLLKQRGFENVKIFEKSDRVGGKSKSIRYRGAVHEMGTVYYAGGYERVIELVQNFTESKQVPANLTYLWNTTAGDAIPPMNRADFYAKLILQDRSDLNATTVQLEFVKQILQYILAYFDIFGVSLGQIPPQPNNMDMVRGSFLEFLTRNNILGTRHYFAGSLTLQGYGQLDEIPAIYGLMWNTPQQVLATILAVGQEERSYGVFSNGFQDLWEQIASKSNLTVQFNTEVTHVDLGNQNRQSDTRNPLSVYLSLNGKVEVEEFDFVVWAIPAVESLCSFSGGDISRERELFSDMTNSYYTTSLVDEFGARRSPAPEDWFFTRILEDAPNTVWATRDSYSFMNGIGGPSYQQGLNVTGNDNKTDPRTMVVYQYQVSEQIPAKKTLMSEIEKHFNGLGASSFRVVDQNSWAYFHRFSLMGIEEGNIWKTLDIQGLNNIWYIGGSTAFDSVKGCVDYNLLLLNRMRPPSE